MSYRRRHLWFRRLALGLAFAAVIFAGRVSVAAAEFDESPGGSVYVTAGGWSGQVDAASGIPLAAGITFGDDRILPEEEVQVIPYLSHGILTEADALRSRGELTSEELAFVNAVVGAAESLHDPLTEGPQGLRSEADATLDDGQFRVEHALEAQAQGGLSGHVVDVAETVIEAAESTPERLTGAARDVHGEADVQEQDGSSEYLTPQHMGTHYPE